MDVGSHLSLGSDIAIRTLKIAQDDLRAKGDAAVQLIEGAAVPANQASSRPTSGTTGTIVNVTV